MAADRTTRSKGRLSARRHHGNFQPYPPFGRDRTAAAQLPESGHKKYVYIRLTEINLFEATLCSVSLCMREGHQRNLAFAKVPQPIQKDAQTAQS